MRVVVLCASGGVLGADGRMEGAGFRWGKSEIGVWNEWRGE